MALRGPLSPDSDKCDVAVDRYRPGLHHIAFFADPDGLELEVVYEPITNP